MMDQGWRIVRRIVNALTLSLVLGQSAAANEWQDVGSIRDVALGYAESLVAASDPDAVLAARDIDSRLRLRQCAQPLESFLPPGASMINGGVVGVRCRAPVAWKIFVPVTVSRHALVARTTRALPAGHKLASDDIEWVRKQLNRSDTLLNKKRDQVVGMMLRQPTQVGQLIRRTMLRAPYVIRRGERVTLAVSNAGLAIRMRGEALSNAGVGQHIRARNDSSGRVVEGVVRDRGLIEISLY